MRSPKTIRTSLTFAGVIALHFSSLAFAQTGGPGSPARQRFDDRAAFYLNQKSAVFFHDMVQKEKILLRMVRNVTAELEARGARTLLNDGIPLSEVYGHSEALITGYAREITSILDLLQQVDRLEETLDLEDGLVFLQPLSDLRQRLRGLFDDWSLFKEQGAFSRSYVAFLAREYGRELNELVSVYRQLDLLRLDASDSDFVLAEITAQKGRIDALFSDLERTQGDTLVDGLAMEVTQIERVLSEIDQMIAQARARGNNQEGQLQHLRWQLTSTLDSRLAALMSGGEGAQGSELAFELFEAWRTQQFAEYEVNFLRHSIIKESLLAQGTQKEQSRMLTRDLKDALTSLAEHSYELAARQFTDVLKDYELYFFDLDGVRFYRAECYYARKLYDLAETDYDAVLKHAADSRYLNETLFRLMLIAEKRGDFAKFYERNQLFLALDLDGEAELKDKVNLLAGYVYLKDERHAEAEAVLAEISLESRYHLSARFLTAQVMTTRSDFHDAVEVLESLVSRKNYPWTKSHVADFRNQALLKLGYLHYEMSDFEKAITCFNRISPGFAQYDRGLLGSAWSYLNMKRFEEALALTNILMTDHFDSETDYEALVLAATSKRHLNLEDGALEDLRYVTSTKRLLDIGRKFGEERRLILAKLNELERLERQAVASQHVDLVRQIGDRRDRLINVLHEFRFASGGEGPLMTAYLAEGDTLLDRIDDVNEVISTADAVGDEVALRQAQVQREHLLETLDRYHDALEHRKRILVKRRPLPTREMAQDYRQSVVGEMGIALAGEQAALRTRLQELHELRAMTEHEKENLDLHVLGNDLTALQQQAERLQTWLAHQDIPASESNFQHWANVSGMGVSDITYNRMRTNDHEVEALADNTETVTRVIRKRHQVLDRRMAEYDELIRRLEYEMQSREYDQYKRENEEYFRDIYFNQDEIETVVEPEVEALESE